MSSNKFSREDMPHFMCSKCSPIVTLRGQHVVHDTTIHHFKANNKGWYWSVLNDSMAAIFIGKGFPWNLQNCRLKWFWVLSLGLNHSLEIATPASTGSIFLCSLYTTTFRHQTYAWHYSRYVNVTIWGNMFNNDRNNVKFTNS